MNNTIRIKLERAIVRALVKQMAAAGFVPVTVWNGEEYAPHGIDRRQSKTFVPTRPLTVDEVIEHVFSVDESTLHFAPARDIGDWGKRGVFLVGGNGEDIISDYHCGDSAFSAVVEKTYKTVENMEIR